MYLCGIWFSPCLFHSLAIETKENDKGERKRDQTRERLSWASAGPAGGRGRATVQRRSKKARSEEEKGKNCVTK